VEHAHLAHVAGHTQVADQSVALLLHPIDHSHTIYVTLDQVPTQTVRRPQGPLEVHRPAARVLREQGAVLGGLDNVDREPAPHDALNGEAGPIDGDALPLP
jgi:hypothetical protein